MPRYIVECGALVTRLRTRTFVIHASSEAEAAEKAEEKFREECRNLKQYTDCGDSVMIDNIWEDS